VEFDLAEGVKGKECHNVKVTKQATAKPQKQEQQESEQEQQEEEK